MTKKAAHNKTALTQKLSMYVQTKALPNHSLIRVYQEFKLKDVKIRPGMAALNDLLKE